MTLTTPLDDLLARLRDESNVVELSVLPKPKLDEIVGKLEPILGALNVAELTPDKVQRLAGLSVVDCIAILRELADALPRFPALQTALGVTGEELLATIELLVTLGGVSHSFASVQEGADAGVLVCAQDLHADVSAALKVVEEVAAAAKEGPTWNILRDLFSAAAQEFAAGQAAAASATAAPGVSTAQQALDDKEVIQALMDHLRGAQGQIPAPAPQTTKKAPKKAPKVPSLH